MSQMLWTGVDKVRDRGALIPGKMTRKIEEIMTLDK